MNNYKLLIEYDGTNYAGWQIQHNAPSVQQTISDALKILLKKEVNLIGSGRTDSGVHALGQTANFRCDEEIDIFRFRHSLNSLLPPDISIKAMNEADENFHARFDAKKRSYIYLITVYKSPVLKNFSFYYHETADPVKLNNASKALTGTHDFRALCKKSNEMENTVCTVYSAHWRSIKGILLFYIEADRYLHGMVRTIVGTLLKEAAEENGKERITEILKSEKRSSAGESVPAKGLFLYKVKY